MRLKLHGELAEQSIIVVPGAQTLSSPSNYLFCLSPRCCHVIFLIDRIEFLYRGLEENASLRFVRCCCVLVQEYAMDDDDRKYSNTRENVLRIYRIRVSRVTETGGSNFFTYFLV